MNTRLFAFSLIATFALTTQAQPVPTRDAPEAAGTREEKKLAFSKRDMVAAAHPLAVEAGLDMLRKGGSAIDAAIAAQMVLNLVEAQSSGIGGGGFLVHHDAKRKKTLAYDGRETAPAGATPNLFLDKDGKPMRQADAVRSGKSVGVPGVLRMLEAAHAAHGVVPWKDLFAPAIKLAETGYPLMARTMLHVPGSAPLLANAETRALFFKPDGTPKAVGTVVTNPAFAKVMRRVANEGADAFYRGEIAERIAAAVRSHERPGTLAVEDLANYRVRISEPTCGSYRQYRLCGMPMPSSGTVAILQMLGVLERFPLTTMRAESAEVAHVFAEAGRLAFADRDKFAADDRFADVPVAGMLNKDYLRARSALINPQKSMGRAAAGSPPVTPSTNLVSLNNAVHAPDFEGGTSHLSVADANGNVVSFTTSVDAFFGSQIYVDGFFLNNQLTDFSMQPTDASGAAVANAVYPGKRPRSSMAPMLVFDERGDAMMAIGSALGTTIINSTAKTILGVLDWKQDIQTAIAAPYIGNSNTVTALERSTSAEKLKASLEALGHETRVADIPSGLHGVVRVKDGWQGGADPRRHGVAAGR